MLSKFSVMNMAKENKEKQRRIRLMEQSRSVLQKNTPTALSEEIGDYMVSIGNNYK
jgi:hypothetical protein